MNYKEPIKIWIAINKNNKLILFKDIPIRNVKKGKWESNNLYINSILYMNVKKLIEKSNLNWLSEPEYLEINI